MTRPSEVAGWFHGIDQRVCDWLLAGQDEADPPGDLVELGAYVGKSAILIGGHLRPGETFTVCDLFDTPIDETANAAEFERSYHGLTREVFERTYLTFHPRLPVIVQAPSDRIAAHVAAGSCRFAHIDASHLYAHVSGDIAAAHTLLTERGVVAIDDYRSAHTPGVAAAVWDAVLHGGLRPIALTAQKVYATWGDPTGAQDELIEWSTAAPDLGTDVQWIAGHRIVRVTQRAAQRLPAPPRQRAAARRTSPPDPGPGTARPGTARQGTAPRQRRYARLRRLARDVLPPVLTRRIVAARGTLRARRGGPRPSAGR